VLVYLGVFQVALAYVFLSRAVTQVRALEVALIGLVEPVLSSTWAWLVHGEAPGIRRPLTRGDWVARGASRRRPGWRLLEA
jgi:drug/metabolite transporter (DMT)-like permease